MYELEMGKTAMLEVIFRLRNLINNTLKKLPELTHHFLCVSASPAVTRD